MVREPSRRFGTGREILQNVRNGLGRVSGPVQGSGMGGGILWKVRDWSGDPPEGLRRMGRTVGIFEMGGEILRKVWDGSEEPS